MPKMKTNSGAKKRFKVTAKGRVKYKQAYSSHMMMSKPKSMKRKARGTDVMIPGDERLVLRYQLPYERNNKRRPKKLSKIKAAANSNKAKKGGK